MTTLIPRPPYTKDELAKLYPSNLELQQVQVVLRHGERTPVKTRFREAGLPAYWPYCTAAKNMKIAILEADGSLDTLQWKRRLESFGQNDSPKLSTGAKGEVDGICQPGELTDRGRETTMALGQRIRKLYIDQLGFLPSTLDDQSLSNIYLRATPIQRALESVQQAFNGLYPATQRSAGLPPPVIVQRAMQDETLFPNNTACKRFGELADAFADRAGRIYDDGPELAYINKKIGKYMPAESPVIRVASAPRLVGVMDSINASRARGKETRLPDVFYDQKLLDDMDRVCVEEWYGGFQRSHEFRKLGIGAMVGDLTEKMVEHAMSTEMQQQNQSFKMSLSGCHDTTVAGALTALGAFDTNVDKWPRFTSSIAFELFKEKSSPQLSADGSGSIRPSEKKSWWSALFPSFQTDKSVSPRTPLQQWPDSERHKLNSYYVRLRYNDKPVTIPFCRPAGRHYQDDESFCTLSAFKEAVDVITPKNWKQECLMNLGNPIDDDMDEKPPGV